MNPLLELSGLGKRYDRRRARFPWRRAPFWAVQEVSFSVAPGEILAVFGESGSGKSTLGRMISRLERPTAGRVIFEGFDWTAASARALRPRRPRLQLVFQDALAALPPHRTARSILRETVAHIGGPRADAERWLREVGLDPALDHRRPEALSGGERQRLQLARALSLGPALLIADEPVSALDVRSEAALLRLLAEERSRRGLALILITHRRRVAEALADRIAVLCAGQLVELFSAKREPCHPYSQALLERAPPPALALGTPSEGCPFAARCPIAEPACARARPPLESVAPDHRLACPVAAQLL